jgi:hypothetical protein
MPRIGNCLLILAVLAAAAVTLGLAADRPAPFALAIVRADGVVIPFATYDGRRWANPWPEPGMEREVPIGLTDVPKSWWGRLNRAPAWTLYPLRGDPRGLTLQRPFVVGTQCQTNIGLQTDYKSPIIPPPAAQPYPKDGVAITGDLRVERITVLNEKSPEWVEIANHIPVTVNDEESKLQFPLARTDRRKREVKLEVLVRAPWNEAGSTVFYFEGMKSYPVYKGTVKQPCDVRTYFSGWLVKRADGSTKTSAQAVLSNCEIRGVNFMLPLGMIRVDEKALWVVQWSGWGHEHYAVAEIGKDARPDYRVRTPGGDCPIM